MKKRIQSVAIIGGGPSGSALACHLVQRGLKVVLFDDGARPEMIVGESLIPSILPMLDRLGVRERVAAVGQYKPGVSFVFSENETLAFDFQAVASCKMPTYAYNVPRHAFDGVIADRAVELGVVKIPQRAKLERVGADGIQLGAESLALFGGEQPDLMVDATGRARAFARLLEIPARTGDRKDVAYFAHYEGFAEEEPRGQVIINRLAVGWSWRIPLPGRLSVGVVLNREEAATLGDTPEQRLEAVIARDPSLSAAGKMRRRVTKVATYTNYQLISERAHGSGWVMVGDAYGFVDPMLSPGLMLALRSAELLADSLNNLPHYAKQMENWLEAWQELIEYFYNGQMFAMYHTGMAIERKYPGVASRIMQRHVERNIACMASGAATLSRYSRGMVRFLSKHGSWMGNPAELAIV